MDTLVDIDWLQWTTAIQAATAARGMEVAVAGRPWEEGDVLAGEWVIMITIPGGLRGWSESLYLDHFDAGARDAIIACAVARTQWRLERSRAVEAEIEAEPYG